MLAYSQTKINCNCANRHKGEARDGDPEEIRPSKKVHDAVIGINGIIRFSAWRNCFAIKEFPPFFIAEISKVRINIKVK